MTRKKIVPVVLDAAGAGLVVIGVALVWVPAALVLAGAALILIAHPLPWAVKR